MMTTIRTSEVSTLVTYVENIDDELQLQLSADKARVTSGRTDRIPNL
jgi:hypothetical protein